MIDIIYCNNSMEIYCLKLESNKYFLHVSECGCSQNNKSDEHILLKAEIYHSYLQKYKPISIIKKIKIENIMEVDSYVKQHMMEYGIDNVRGGSYSEEDMHNIVPNVLHELQHCNRHHDKTRDSWVDNLLSDISSINKKCTAEEIAFKKHDLENTLAKYKREKRQLETISIEGSQIIQDIQWIKEACSRNVEIHNATNQNKNIQIKNNEIKDKYKKVLASLNQIHAIFCSCSLSEGSIFTNDIHVKYPHFLLDDFFYHWHHIHLERHMEEVQRVCSVYEDMTNKITQKMKEIESILETYDHDLEWKIPRELHLLCKQLEDPSLKQP